MIFFRDFFLIWVGCKIGEVLVMFIFVLVIFFRGLLLGLILGKGEGVCMNYFV